MNRKHWTLVAAALALAACGGGEKKTAEAPKPSAAPAARPAEEAAPASSYTGGPVVDGGTLSGVVTYGGTEADGTLTITKDQETCLPAGSTNIPAETLVATAGKLQNVVVWIDGVTAGKAFTPAPVEVDNKGCHFVPHVVVGWQGSRVVAKNSDPILHNTHLTLREGGKTLANIALPNQGQTQEKELKKKGIVEVTCDAHEWMKGYIFVSDHPYALVTGADGAYNMTDVPPGTYTVNFWHERLGQKTASVTIGPAATVTADMAF
jgi:plastocyanin